MKRKKTLLLIIMVFALTSQVGIYKVGILLVSVGLPILFILAFIGFGITLAMVIGEWFDTIFHRDL
jgi:hypothetical protein